VPCDRRDVESASERLHRLRSAERDVRESITIAKHQRLELHSKFALLWRTMRSCENTFRSVIREVTSGTMVAAAAAAHLGTAHHVEPPVLAPMAPGPTDSDAMWLVDNAPSDFTEVSNQVQTHVKRVNNYLNRLNSGMGRYVFASLMCRPIEHLLSLLCFILDLRLTGYVELQRSEVAQLNEKREALLHQVGFQ